jgi:hypothetical protein
MDGDAVIAGREIGRSSLCVRTVDRGAPYGGCVMRHPLSSSGLHVCAVWVRLCWLNGRLHQLKVKDAPKGPPLHTIATRT